MSKLNREQTLEIYSETRIREFDETNQIPDALKKRVRKRIADKL